MGFAPLVVPGRVEVVAAVTGEGSPNRTGTRFGFLATDLGILWDDGAGGVLAAFGDTYGEGWREPGAGARTEDHRRNVLARCTSAAHGLALDEVIEDAPGHAAEILPADPRRWCIESTVIPTAGIAVDGVQYMHYMSVRRWGRPGRWRTNYGGIARSEDGGRTWTKDRRARWRNSLFGGRPFQMGGFARDETHVYLFGTRNGRYGPVYLARVEPAGVGEPGRYEYWTGSGWSGRMRRSRPVANGPAGELSVAYHSGLGVWLMVHLDDPGGRLLLRGAHDVTGPWSDGEPLLTGREHPGLYGGYLHPHALDADHIYFTVSRWDPYNVFLARAEVALS
ncbi:DUF4185 domain-containing protein [Pseudonocardia acaciae]|uniref:DUF4185 domain-containing protein n=1 Tax=Pseudonocardia acaciae TaxID=551276 RepID=UPI0006886890|nr:DUF4185 domain-containing protein [Pseudonocardia acaciae]